VAAALQSDFGSMKPISAKEIARRSGFAFELSPA